MRDINFLNSNEFLKKNKQSREGYDRYKIATIGLIVVILLGYGILWTLDYAVNVKIKMININIKQYSKVIEINGNIDKYNNRMNNLSKILQKADSKEIMNSDLLKTIGEVMPDNIVLLNYTAGENSKISIEGRASNTESIAQFTYGLKKNEFLHEVQLKTINESKNGKITEYTFLIELK